MLVYSLCSLYRRVSTVNKMATKYKKPLRDIVFISLAEDHPRVKDFFTKNHCNTAVVPLMKTYMNVTLQLNGFLLILL
jgi:hypothetical protein